MPKYTDPFAASTASAVGDDPSEAGPRSSSNAASAKNRRKPSDSPMNLPPTLISEPPTEKNPAQIQKAANANVNTVSVRRDRAMKMPHPATSSSKRKNGPAASGHTSRNSMAVMRLLHPLSTPQPALVTAG